MRLISCAPVLARPDGSTQVGTERPVRLPDLGPSARRVLAMAESVPLGELETRGLGEATDALRAAGLIASPATAPGGTVAIHGAGRLGLELGHALSACGLAVGFVDRRPAHEEPDLYPRRAVVSTCAGGAAWALRERCADARLVPPHDPDLAVLISLGGAARHATSEWEHDDLPHLLIAVDERGVTVGPLVVPGLTACGRCLALTRTAQDPAWPSLLDQLSGRSPRLDPEVVPDAVAVALRLALRHLRSGAPSGEAWRIEPGHSPVRADSAAHPDCGCGAA